MLKNLNDYISFGLLIFIVLYTLRLFLVALFPSEGKFSLSKAFKDFLNYQDNIDE